ncbi:MAG TPA: hypothetical protein VHF25_13845 [Nitriliruptorales bacterium]|nr:hypothetical protein [Nitriliruptorales bacterium]
MLWGEQLAGPRDGASQLDPTSKRARGITVHWGDCVIAAAVTADATLATGGPTQFLVVEVRG